MSEVEDPTATVVRLLENGMHVVKDDASLAQIRVSIEWYDRELLRNYDGQISVGLVESQEQKVEMAGKLRRRLGLIRVNVWTADKQGASDSGRLMRSKMVAEVNRVVRQNRDKPNETFYSFVGVGPSTGTHKAYYAGSAEELSPGSVSWDELASEEYEALWYSDDMRFSTNSEVDGEYALLLLGFKVGSRRATVRQIVLSFEGYGSASGGNGITMKVWNRVAGAWQNAQSLEGGEEGTVVVSVDSDVVDYVDDNGYVWLLARTMNPSDGAIPAVLYCDYTSCVVTVNGITYLDVVSFRDADFVEVKPFIFRTEFTLKSWFFENIGGI